MHCKTSFLRPLFDYLEQFHPLAEAFKVELEKSCKLIHIKKSKHILSPIDTNVYLYFLVNGLVRGFVRDGKNDISTWFSTGNEIIGAIRHPHQRPSHSFEYLHALEECQLICIPYTLIDSMYDHYPEANLIGRKLFALQHYAASERAILARIPKAMGRYRKLQESGLDINRIPQRYLASYLGMRLETLSRIRHKFLTLDYRLCS
ncbi:cAMP-binding domain of CRP or a regulatory subunit of cAMP-dependent protein kinases [Pedobacter terrae]|uniref:cAMP-binding domain of CRP or a regulatory subunit of cAMP-dependent protein kinases n=1 Tax=Pedobacter terrae TaxID=405671 RepID=A0A1G7MYU0_9SPHI|nr:Crp/Fnr family transcriptional regulator [Pedobacter terrae]SDF66968.1 cAMP-binding domain of CRP or a regulatory subunit of cAMP-dependent protein kinases [Pedobacter terrae]